MQLGVLMSDWLLFRELSDLAAEFPVTLSGMWRLVVWNQWYLELCHSKYKVTPE
jgi:hypothetical protein